MRQQNLQPNFFQGQKGHLLSRTNKKERKQFLGKEKEEKVRREEKRRPQERKSKKPKFEAVILFVSLNR